MVSKRARVGYEEPLDTARFVIRWLQCPWPPLCTSTPVSSQSKSMIIWPTPARCTHNACSVSHKAYSILTRSRLYPWRLDRSNREHYFVVYASEAEAAGAIALSTPDVIVKPMAGAPQQLVEVFNAVARGPFGDRPPTTTSSADLTPRYTTPSPTSPSSSHSNSASPLTPTGHSRDPESTENGQRAAKRVKLLKHAMHTDLAFDSLYAPSPSASSMPGPSGLPYISLSTRRPTGKQIDGSGGGLDRGRSRTPPPALLSPPPSPIPVNLGSSAANANANANANGRPHSSSFIPSGAPPMRASLVMSLCGQSISIDLDALDEDPQAVISLLKAAEADRDKWMLVGGAYRRKGNLNAAISVVHRMLEGILPTRLISNSSPLTSPNTFSDTAFICAVYSDEGSIHRRRTTQARLSHAFRLPHRAGQTSATTEREGNRRVHRMLRPVPLLAPKSIRRAQTRIGHGTTAAASCFVRTAEGDQQ